MRGLATGEPLWEPAGIDSGRLLCAAGTAAAAAGMGHRTPNRTDPATTRTPHVVLRGCRIGEVCQHYVITADISTMIAPSGQTMSFSGWCPIKSEGRGVVFMLGKVVLTRQSWGSTSASACPSLTWHWKNDIDPGHC